MWAGIRIKIKHRASRYFSGYGFKMLKRPVQMTVTRQQMFTNTGMRQHNEQRMQIGAKKDGSLTALSHDTLSHTSTYQEYQEPCGMMSKMLYKVPNNEIKYSLIPMNFQTPFAMRAPGEATGSFALESAMDEMAWKLKMDPVDFRIKMILKSILERANLFLQDCLQNVYELGQINLDGKTAQRNPAPNRKVTGLLAMG